MRARVCVNHLIASAEPAIYYLMPFKPDGMLFAIDRTNSCIPHIIATGVALARAFATATDVQIKTSYYGAAARLRCPQVLCNCVNGEGKLQSAPSRREAHKCRYLAGNYIAHKYTSVTCNGVATSLYLVHTCRWRLPSTDGFTHLFCVNVPGIPCECCVGSADILSTPES